MLCPLDGRVVNGVDPRQVGECMSPEAVRKVLLPEGGLEGEEHLDGGVVADGAEGGLLPGGKLRLHVRKYAKQDPVAIVVCLIYLEFRHQRSSCCGGPDHTVDVQRRILKKNFCVFIKIRSYIKRKTTISSEHSTP